MGGAIELVNPNLVYASRKLENKEKKYMHFTLLFEKMQS